MGSRNVVVSKLLAVVVLVYVVLGLGLGVYLAKCVRVQSAEISSLDEQLVSVKEEANSWYNYINGYRMVEKFDLDGSSISFESVGLPLGQMRKRLMALERFWGLEYVEEPEQVMDANYPKYVFGSSLVK